MAKQGRPPLDPSTLLRVSAPPRGWIPALGGRNDGWGERMGRGVPARRGVRLQEGWIPASAGKTDGGEDLQATLDKAESLGGKTTMPIMEIPGMVTLAQFSDPDGNVIGIVQSGG